MPPPVYGGHCGRGQICLHLGIFVDGLYGAVCIGLPHSQLSVLTDVIDLLSPQRAFRPLNVTDPAILHCLNHRIDQLVRRLQDILDNQRGHPSLQGLDPLSDLRRRQLSRCLLFVCIDLPSKICSSKGVALIEKPSDLRCINVVLSSQYWDENPINERLVITSPVVGGHQKSKGGMRHPAT